MTPDWRDKIKAGDVLYTKSGPRVVRSVTYKKKFLLAVTLSILRCSWTSRPYTVIGRVDLAYRNFAPTNLRVTSMTLLDKRLNACIQDHTNRSLDCCDVKDALR